MSARIVIAAPSSGAGKTTVTVGLMAAFRRQGLQVQGFKVGPDYIDPSYHRAVTGRPSRNLDVWMGHEEALLQSFFKGAQTADVNIVEGVMGLFDGRDVTSSYASTAHVATLLKSPILLVVDAGSMARSAAAVVKGFQLFEPSVSLAGVVVNRVGSERHYQLVRQAIETECRIPTVGYLTRDSELSMPERHLGLLPAIERGDMEPFFKKLADQVQQNIDLHRILQMARGAPRLARPVLAPVSKKARRTVAVAYDEAFNFYYPDNLEILEGAGGRIVYFSPLAGEPIPDEAEALYLGGGFPEEFVSRLASRPSILDAYRSRVLGGLPTLAECGGLMFLGEYLYGSDGRRYPMVGAIPLETEMTPRLQGLGYREVEVLESTVFPKGARFRGHEFHYSRIRAKTDRRGHGREAYRVKGFRGQTIKDGYSSPTLIAGYSHLYFPSNPAAVGHWLNLAVEGNHAWK